MCLVMVFILMAWAVFRVVSWFQCGGGGGVLGFAFHIVQVVGVGGRAFGDHKP